MKFILTPLGDLRLSGKLVNDEVQTLFQMHLKAEILQLLQAFNLDSLGFFLGVITSSLPSINAEGLEPDIGE